MTGFAITGGRGFLGWHTRAALRERGHDAALIPVGESFDLRSAAESVDAVDRLIHIAGVNRDEDDAVREGNLAFAEQIASAAKAAVVPPRVIVYANSTQAGNGTVYGTAKEAAGRLLAETATSIGADFIDVRLPNLFGEHGRPFYNAVTSTFAHLLARGDQPVVQEDKKLTLLHAQNAADVLIGNVEPTTQTELEVTETVSGLLRRLSGFAATYARGDIPDMRTEFDRDLFNTYRSYTFPDHAPLRLTRHADERGSFFEVIRTHGGPGQSSFSTTRPGITRGDHFHRRKIERFTVLSGRARISLRRLFDDRVVSFDVDGDNPAAVDMPTMWSHNITNTADDLLYTSFWTNDIFNPENPDTIAEVV